MFYNTPGRVLTNYKLTHAPFSHLYLIYPTNALPVPASIVSISS